MSAEAPQAAARRVCVVTGSRAEYGMLSPLMSALAAADDIDLKIAVTGAHLAPGFGETWREIEADGFYIEARIDMDLVADSDLSTAKSIGRGVIGFAGALSEMAPALVVVLGDRYEILAAAIAAFMLRLPLLHLHGGERTEGALDESIRHAVTKLAHIHCVATEEFAARVRQLGEAPEHVHVVGTLALDKIRSTPLLDRAALARDLGFHLGPAAPDRPLFVVTFHPATAEGAVAARQIKSLLAALERKLSARIVFTLPNADPGHAAIRRAIRDWTAANAARAVAFDHLGSRRYWSLLAIADAVIGNSSSGVIEAPHFGVPVVNVGDRQRGRPRPPAVIDCAADAEAISQAIDRALSEPHRVLAARRETPYGGAGAAQRILEVIRKTPFKGVAVKKFHDMPVHA